MGVIFMPNHLIWKRLQCVHIFSMIMHFHTGNVYLDAVLTVHVSIFLTKKQIKNLEETTPSIRFHIYHIIGSCTDNGIIPLKEKKYVTRVNKNLHQINLQKYTPENS